MKTISRHSYFSLSDHINIDKNLCLNDEFINDYIRDDKYTNLDQDIENGNFKFGTKFSYILKTLGYKLKIQSNNDCRYQKIINWN